MGVASDPGHIFGCEMLCIIWTEVARVRGVAAARDEVALPLSFVEEHQEDTIDNTATGRRAHNVGIGLADLVAVDVDVGRLHLLEALDGLPDHDRRARQSRPLALQHISIIIQRRARYVC